MVALLTLLLLSAVPDQAKPRDVVECLLALPAEIGPLRGLPADERKRSLESPGAVVDKKNGYLSFSTDWTDAGWTDPYTIQVAVFRHRVDDGQQDISTDEDRARYAAIEEAVSAGSRTVSLTWNRKAGRFTKKP